jgi:hypothetical protein
VVLDDAEDAEDAEAMIDAIRWLYCMALPADDGSDSKRLVARMRAADFLGLFGMPAFLDATVDALVTRPLE